MLAKYKETVNHIADLSIKRDRKEITVTYVAEFISWLFRSCAFVLLGILFYKKAIDLGIFWAFYFALSSLTAQFTRAFSNASVLIELCNFVEPYFTFLDKQITAKPVLQQKLHGTIRFSQVSFAYPEQILPAIKNVSFSIEKGEYIGIVGYNGSGKSTLAKLILGLYPPQSGTYTVDGTVINAYDENQFFLNKTAVFQTIVSYIRTIKENVCISSEGVGISMDALNRDKDIATLLKTVGLNWKNVKNMPDGLDTVLLPDFMGGRTFLSSGQLQSLQTARGLYRGHDIIILDEPSASLDPIKEIELYNRFLEYVKGKTAILISHRLASVKNTHRIIVLDKGEIAEIGSFDELLRNKGLFSKMWAAQAAWY